ncbi:MAG: hypothetical protein H7A55_15820 [Verrucomicrobiaceae bacterium]|nr:hypothetical protein [Verrucomicrobiaceae bacterium]
MSSLETIDPSKPANITTTRVDLASEPREEWKTLAAMIAGKPLPHLMLRFPLSSGRPQPILTLSLAEAKTRPALWDSPARETIADRIGQGESAVWVMIESGDKAHDDATAALIDARLEYLMSVLSLPKLDELDIANGLVSIPESDLRLDFTLLRLSRNDPAEQTFITMLLKTEAGLEKVRDPIVIPVFGRGRALYALVGDGIRPETIEQAATFLIGKCSCQVKEKNPGNDLLFATDWSAQIKAGALTDRELPTLADLTQNIPVTTHPTAPGPIESPRPLWPWLILPLMLLIPAHRFFRKS